MNSLAIVGASVRGTAVLDRVLASAPLLAGGPLTIHVVDPHEPGSGRIWREQPQKLLMNTVAGQSTVFTDETVVMDGPVRPGPNLHQWCRDVAPTLPLPAAVAEEAARTVAWSHPSRLLYGHYLRWAFRRVLASAPTNIHVVVHAARAAALTRADGFDLRLDDGSRLSVGAVILALGWLPRRDVIHHPRVVAADNPIDQDFSRIRPGERIVVRGLGMNFFDVVSLLTECRGGRFEPEADGLCYVPSGEEPVILAGSRRGVPFRAKPLFGRVPPPAAAPSLRAALPSLLQRRPVDFKRDVLPLIEADAHSEFSGLDLAAAIDPLPKLRAAHPELDIDALVALAVSQDAVQAALGGASPLKRALHSYQAARNALIELATFGGFTPESFRDFRRFHAAAATFGSGPPLIRAQQVLALHRAGLVRFLGPGLEVDLYNDHVTARASYADPVEASWLVEGWLSMPSVEHAADPLLRSLIDGGLAAAWRLSDGAATDAVAVRREDGAVLGKNGAVPGLYSVGIPHEDLRGSTAVSPIPETNSHVLREVDGAARSALTYLTMLTRARRNN